jgi:hypothetical protein
MARKCIERKGAAGIVNKAKAKSASKRIDEITAALTAQGEDVFSARAQADAKYVDELAAKNLKAKWKMIHRIRVMNGLQKAVDAAPVTKMGGLAVKMVEDADYEGRAIHAQIMGKVGEFLEKTRVTITGKVPDKAQFTEFLKALRGEATADVQAKAMADAVNDTNEWIRKTLNSLGYNIGKLDNWGITQTHDQLSINKAGLATWRAELDGQLDWANMIDPKSGMPFGAKPSDTYRMEFLAGMFDNLVYGRDSTNPVWAAVSAGNGLEKHRVLQFKSTDDWLAYNGKYGMSDPHTMLLSHFSTMSRRIAMARRFGPDHNTALDYMGQLVSQKARENNLGLPAAMKANAGVVHAQRMARVLQGSSGPVGWKAAFFARGMSTTRQLLSASLLDRAIVISAPSDINSMRIAAKAIGMNPANVMSDYVKLMGENVAGGGTTRDDLLRMGHIFASWGNPGVTMARYAQDFPAAAFAEKLSNAAMRLQGMNAHTDGLRVLFQKWMGGHFMSLSQKSFADLPDIMRRSFGDEGITAADWDAFRSSGGEFTASNGATFLDPLYWREATTAPNKEELFLKMQSFVEKWTDLAVPTRSLRAAGVMDPVAYGLTPGTAMYELMQSTGMFKSFPAAFIVNQLKMLGLRQGAAAKASYVTDLVLSTTLVGAMGIQVGDLLMGRDPRNMNPMDNPNFWMSALLRGGGLGPIGDVLSTGTTSWGSGLAGYATGPVVQLGTDVMKLTLGNLAQAYNQAIDGDDIDMNFMEELFKFQRRYTPLGQTPVAAGGAAFDRMFSEQLQIFLDPDSANSLHDAERRRQNLYGNAAWWTPGRALPSRAPSLAGNRGICALAVE